MGAGLKWGQVMGAGLEMEAGNGGRLSGRFFGGRFQNPGAGFQFDKTVVGKM